MTLSATQTSPRVPAMLLAAHVQEVADEDDDFLASVVIEGWGTVPVVRLNAALRGSVWEGRAFRWALELVMAGIPDVYIYEVPSSAPEPPVAR